MLDASRRENNLNLLRLAMATAVVFGHCFDLIPGSHAGEPLAFLFRIFSPGAIAILGFFIISGCLVTRSWRSDPHLARYASRRFLRIVPAFVVAFWASVLVAGALGAADAGAYFAALPAWTLARDLVLLSPPVTPPTFVGTFRPEVDAPLWSIRWEAVCYALVPLVAMVPRPKALLLAGWACLAVTVVCKPDLMLNRLLLMFLSGALFALRPPRDFRWWPLAVLALVAVLAIEARVASLVDHLVPVAMATAGTYLLLGFGFSRPILRPFPDISYGVYLYGWPAEKLLLWWGARDAWLLFAGSFAMAASLGYLSCRLIERPALALRIPRDRAPA